jgi:hypothetical protein
MLPGFPYLPLSDRLALRLHRVGHPFAAFGRQKLSRLRSPLRGPLRSSPITEPSSLLRIHLPPPTPSLLSVSWVLHLRLPVNPGLVASPVPCQSLLEGPAAFMPDPVRTARPVMHLSHLSPRSNGNTGFRISTFLRHLIGGSLSFSSFKVTCDIFCRFSLFRSAPEALDSSTGGRFDESHWSSPHRWARPPSSAQLERQFLYRMFRPHLSIQDTPLGTHSVGMGAADEQQEQKRPSAVKLNRIPR